jgi:hypothetical protein
MDKKFPSSPGAMRTHARSSGKVEGTATSKKSALHVAVQQPANVSNMAQAANVSLLGVHTMTTPTAKITALKYSPTAIRAALIALKGAEKGPATFEAVAPVFSALVVSGGSKAELSATTATAQVFKELHAEKAPGKPVLNTPTAKAFRAACTHALADFKVNGRASDQAAHDMRMSTVAALWCTFFRDATPKTVDATVETSKAKITRLEGELMTMRMERDAMAAALNAMREYAGQRSDAALANVSA